MPTYVKVCINGFVLSTLLFDCANNSGDQEGFLYGSITRNVRREISDQSMSNTQEDILISVCSSVPCGSFLSFYNNVGEINREDLEYNLGDRIENIVGWYRYRRYSAMYPSAREQVIHKKLRALFATSSSVDDSYFVFGLLSSSNLPNFATHSFDYGFFTQRIDDTFKNLNLTILNLGDTRNSYRSGSMALPFMNSSSFHSVLSSSWNFNTFYETEDQIQQFHQRLRMKLESLQEELAASDAVNATLEDDIRRLSNEMQTLLATQERLTSAARGTHTTDQRVEEVIEQKDKESGSSKEEESSISDEKKNDFENNLPVIVQVFSESCEMEELPKAGESSGSGRESPRKRSALTPLESDRTKRACPDKYFEKAEYHVEDLDGKPVSQSVDKAAPDVSSAKQEDNILSSSQMLVVDPDSGEMSAAHSEIESMKPEVTSCQLQGNSVPSNTVEIIISSAGTHRLVAQTSASFASWNKESINSRIPLSDITPLYHTDPYFDITPFCDSISFYDGCPFYDSTFDDESGSSTSEELSDMKESPELSDVKESNSDSAISPKETLSSGPSSHSIKAIESEHHSEMISSTTQDLSDKLALNENILSSSSVTKASSSRDSPSTVNRPFIVYASKETKDSSIHPNQPSSCQSSELKESPQKVPEDKSEAKNDPPCDQSEDGRKATCEDQTSSGKKE